MYHQYTESDGQWKPFKEPTNGVEPFKCTITDKLHKAWYSMVLLFKAKIRIVPNCTAIVENLGGLETMAPVYFFLTIDQRFPFNINYLCLSIVRPPRYLLTKNDHNLIISSFLYTVSLEPILSSTLFLNTRTEYC